MVLLASLGLATTVILAILFIIVITSLVENDLGTVATILILAICGALYFTGGQETTRFLLEGIRQNIWQYMTVVILYLAIGVIYSFVKWFYFVKDQKRKGWNTPPKASDNTPALIRWIYFILAFLSLVDSIRRASEESG
jgi:formate hydrogenlyase subunit 3/multisubunit Na+/H+ antiporter MnhD subunit